LQPTSHTEAGVDKIMSRVTISNDGIQTEQLKTIARDMGKKLTDGEKRPWHLEAAISFTIALLGTAVWLASAQVV
jgi:hypothetical protein